DPLRRKGCFLVSGGAGGVGRHVVRLLVEHYGHNVLVLGRRALAGDEIYPGSYRARVRYVRGDICDPHVVYRAVHDASLAWGQGLGGIVHLAAVYERRTLRETSGADFARISDAKINGARVLLALQREHRDATFVAMSSVNAILGNYEQGAYSAA